MIEKIIELSIRNRFLVFVLAIALTIAGIYATLHTPVDAIPDLSENQVIVFTDWMGRSPREIEDQITYPLSLKLEGLAGVRAVRSSSEFNFSMITLIFEDNVDFYFARERVTEKLAQANTFLPSGVVPYLAPDATALGQIYWYTVEASPENPIDSGRLWALNKFYIGPQLNSALGVADVAIVGGTPLEYQVDVRPEDLRSYGITLGELFSAVGQSNMPAGGGVVQKNNAEYIVRGVGWIRDKQDIENTVIKQVNGIPIYVKTVATVQLGTQFRRSVFEKNGNEVTGGAVLMRQGENPLTVTERVKEKIRELQPGLPAGVHIVAAYDRTRLIHGALDTLTDVMGHEMLIASVAVLLILMHFRSVFVICITLPLAVLFSFLLMWLLRIFHIVDIQANIMSLAGITISIGILVDQAIVMTENATHHLKAQFGDRPVTGDIREMVIAPCRTVGRPIFFSVMIMLLSFIPVFMLSGREGKLFHPLAFTKSFAMIGVALISITLVPALIPTFIKGRLRSEEENWIVRSFTKIYKPLLTWALPRRNLVMWFFAAMLIVAAGIFPMQALLGMGASGTYPPLREGGLVEQFNYLLSDTIHFVTGTAPADVAWKICFFVVFGLVTAVTVIATTGKRGRDIPFLILALCLIATFGVLARIGMLMGELGMRYDAVHIVLPVIGTITFHKWTFVALKWFFCGVAVIPIFFAAFRTQHIVLWRTIALVSLVLVACWVYRVPKIGASFMPPLDEGTTLDMPITVPRASVTQTADDLKARDALLRGFPEVESVIGKSGRADTPTDPAPLDMVETFVNYRPREFWPKRVLRYDDAARQTGDVLTALEQRGFLVPAPHEDDRTGLIVDASQKALVRFDETMRELALLRYTEFETELGPLLTRYAVTEAIRRMQAAGAIQWPEGKNEQTTIDALAAKLTPKYGHWLSTTPTKEDVTQLSRDVAENLHEMGAIKNVVQALEVKRGVLGELAAGVAELSGVKRETFASGLYQAIEAQRTALWRARVERINWELADRGTEAFTWYAIEELVKAAQGVGLISGAPHAQQSERLAVEAVHAQLNKKFKVAAFQPFQGLREELEKPFRDRVFLWPRQSGPKGDLVDDEMGRVLQVPGWTNIFTQPIINRIEMLSTGVRTDIGVKVFGPDLDTIDRVGKQIETALKPLTGARDVVAAPFMGKGYLQIDIDRVAAARYGISVEDIQNEIEMAMAGRAVTYTVEKRDRFPVRLRYARANREDEESVRRLLISPSGMASSPTQNTMSMGGASAPAAGNNETAGSASSSSEDAHSAAPGHSSKGRLLIPLSAVARVRIVEGPAMIKSENGRLVNYVTLNVRGRDIVGFVDEAQRVVAQKVHLPEGVHIEWSGEFEHQVRAAQTLRFVFPAVILVIFVILYLTYKDLWDAALMMMAVPEALAGGIFFMFLFPKITGGWDAPPMDFSVAVWVGLIACFGMATETGIIMLVYLREAIEKRGGLEKIRSLEELRRAVIEGAVQRLRPKLLTEGVAIIAIFPMVFAKGVGGEILAPMALPVLGGLLVADEVVDIFLPVRFYWIRRARWLKLHAKRIKEESLTFPVKPSATIQTV